MVSVDTKRCYEEPIEFPKELHVELTNKCNLKCNFCPTGRREIKRPYGFMREDLFWGICTEAYDYGAALKLIRWGEPTLHVKCFDYIKKAKSIGLLVHLNTNAVNLDVKQVLSSGLDSIKVSLHSLQAVKSVNKLIKKRGKRVKPFITIAELSSETAVRGRCRREGCYETLKGDKFVYAPTKHLYKETRPPKTCYELYNRLSIDWDGTVVACCGAYDRQMKLGHVYDKNTLKEIWDGPKLKMYRNYEQKHRLDLVPLCNHCARTFKSEEQK
jgi:radical SAM protein with 4Fe4S-binding SPASM domain